MARKEGRDVGKGGEINRKVKSAHNASMPGPISEGQLNSIGDQVNGMRKTLGDKDHFGAIKAEKDAPFFKHNIKGK